MSTSPSGPGLGGSGGADFTGVVSILVVRLFRCGVFLRLSLGLWGGVLIAVGLIEGKGDILKAALGEAWGEALGDVTMSIRVSCLEGPEKCKIHVCTHVQACF